MSDGKIRLRNTQDNADSTANANGLASHFRETSGDRLVEDKAPSATDVDVLLEVSGQPGLDLHSQPVLEVAPSQRQGGGGVRREDGQDLGAGRCESRTRLLLPSVFFFV